VEIILKYFVFFSKEVQRMSLAYCPEFRGLSKNMGPTICVAATAHHTPIF
jgi:hypothetical protein